MKKKLLSVNVFKLDEFINRVFYHKPSIFVSTSRFLYEINTETMVKTAINTFAVPTELLYVDRFGSFIARSNESQREQLWLVDSSTNGVFVAQTIRRNGNYK
jgi:hypothetical protein